MMTSKANGGAYVWIWLPGCSDPIVAGKLTESGEDLAFNYGKSYLTREDAIPIYDIELPLRSGELPLLNGLHMPNCIRDAAPDAWGRRVIMNKVLGTSSADVDTIELSELTYLLESGSDRIGALDFQSSPTEYIPRWRKNATLEELTSAAEKVERGVPLSHELDQALLHGSSIGGARPKALVEEDEKKYIAKFSSTNDLYGVVKAEYVAMRLAQIVGLDVAPVLLRRVLGKDVLLIERFDRIRTEGGWLRKHMVSALTLFGLDDMTARYASYEQFAEIVRHRFRSPSETLRELFARMTFNVLSGNTDDHARNHAAFWDGELLELTPAYDICPQPRTGNEASQAMRIHGPNNMSQIEVCLEAAPAFQLTRGKAREIVANQVELIRAHWDDVCEEAKLSEIDMRALQDRQFLNPYSMVGLNEQ